MKGLNFKHQLASLLYIFFPCNILFLLPQIVWVLKITSTGIVHIDLSDLVSTDHLIKLGEKVHQ